ncbi:MAG TPA: hypothetical protein VE262_14680 [Blastocatellia bacterium]|nr:hypothetical protein [Blastocatellia bacterium]
MARKDHGNGHDAHPDELPDVSYIQNEDVKHEHTDVPISPIAKFLTFLTVAIVVISVGLYFFFGFLEGRARKQATPPGPLASERTNIPPEPRLQLMPGHEVHPLDEWKRMKAEEEQAISSYGWVDQNAGVVRIPIEEAKKLVLQQGLPSKPTAARPEEVEESVPSDQSSGKVLQRRRRQ